MCACQISLCILWKNPIAAHMIDVLHGLIFWWLMEKKKGTAEKGGMRKGKRTSVCRTVKLSSISRGEENQETVNGREKKINHRELQGEETGTAKLGTLEMASLGGTKSSPLYSLCCRYFYQHSICHLFLWFSKVAVAVTRQMVKKMFLEKLCMWVGYLLLKNIPKLPFLVSIDVTQWCLTALTVLSPISLLLRITRGHAWGAYSVWASSCLSQNSFSWSQKSTN